MASIQVGQIYKYNSLEKTLFSTANRQWDDTTAGNIMFCLVGATYTPSATHSTTANITTGLITSGNGGPQPLLTPSISNTTMPGSTLFGSSSAFISFTASPWPTAKYVVAVQPVTAGTVNGSTDNLLFWFDLNPSGGNFPSNGFSVLEIIVPGVNFAGIPAWFETT